MTRIVKSKSARAVKAKAKAKPKAKRAPSVGETAIASLTQALAYVRGEDVKGIVVHKPVNVAAIRAKTGLSQDRFAAKYGLSVVTVRAWEQQQRFPDRASLLYLMMIDEEPEAVERVLLRA